MRRVQSGAGTELLRAAGARTSGLESDLDFTDLSMLIVDDNRFTRTLVKQMCRAFGIRDVMEADDAAEAFRLLKHKSVDLIMIDYLMSPLSGTDFVKLIRTAEDSKCQEVPIIMMTGHTERENVVEARDAGVTELLAKPLSAYTLLSRIVRVFEKPRPFLRTADYTGPCRRRKFVEWHGGERRGRPRRKTAVADDGVEIDQRWGLTPRDVEEFLSEVPEASAAGHPEAAG